MKDFDVIKTCFDYQEIKQEAKRLENIEADKTYFFEDSGEIRSIFAPHWRSEVVNNFIYRNPAISYVKKVLGNDIYIHQCHYNFKKAYTGGDFAWHSDYTYWHNLDGMPDPFAISMLYVLDDFTPQNGPLQILPDSHTLPIEKFETDKWTIKHSSNESLGIVESKTLCNAVQLHAQAGDCIAMHANTLHASEANTSSKDRTVLFVCYNRLDNKTTKHTRPDYITLRDFTPV